MMTNGKRRRICSMLGCTASAKDKFWCVLSTSDAVATMRHFCSYDHMHKVTDRFVLNTCADFEDEERNV